DRAGAHSHYIKHTLGSDCVIPVPSGTPDSRDPKSMQGDVFQPRQAEVSRNTNETQVSVTLGLDGTGRYQNATGVGFLDHMLDLFARHGGFDLDVRCKGDLHIDEHHTVEDVGITLGQAFRQALGDKAYIARYGHAYVPMDE